MGRVWLGPPFAIPRGMSSYRLGLLVLLALSISALVSAAPTPPIPPSPPAHVLSYVPAKPEVTPGDVRGGIRVTFDRDMLLPADVGKVVAGPVFEFTPVVLGDARWMDLRTLAFFPKDPLASSTTYQLRLSPRLAKDLGQTIEAWPGLRFVYDRIRVTNLSGDGDSRFTSTVPTIRLTLSQASTPKNVVDACAFCSARANASEPCTRAVVVPTEARPSDTRFSLSSQNPLRSASKYQVRCAAGLMPAAGDAGTSQVSEREMTTYGPAKVAEVEPSDSSVAADKVRVSITFTTPVEPKLVREYVELIDERGASKPIDFSGRWDRTTYAWSGSLDIGAAYGIRIKPGLKDIFGQALLPGTIHTFQVGDYAPKLRMERGIFVVERGQGRYPVWTRNLDSFRLRCAEVPESRLAAVLTGPSNHDSSDDAWWDASQAGEIDYKNLHLGERQKSIRVRGPRNQWRDVSLNLAEVCGSRAKSGVYLLESSLEGEASKSDSQVHRSLASVTDLGLVAKVGNASSLVWVVSLSTGKPVAGATVRIRDLQGKVRFQGTTNSDGVAQGPGATLLADVKPGHAANGDGEGDEGEWDENRARRVIVTAQSSDDFAVLDTNWDSGIQVWNFGVGQDRNDDRSGGNVRVRGFLHSDRGLYRPGDTVHLKGLLRLLDVSGTMAVPAKKRKVHLVIKDPRNKVLADENLAISEFGGFHKDLVLPADANLGDYPVRGEIEGQGFSDRFSVEEYRPRTFEVKVSSAKKDILIGEPLRFEVKANFLYGSPLAGGKLTYSVRRRQHLPVFRGFDDYVFQDYAGQYDLGRTWAHDEERSFSSLVGDGEADLNRAGVAHVVVKDKDRLTAPQDYIFEATVADATGELVTKSQVVSGHTSNLYLGLHPSEFVQAVDMPFAVQVVGMDRDGTRREAQAELEIVRRSYDCGPHGTEGYWSCHATVAKTPAVKRTIAVPASGSAAVERVLLKEPGEYIVRVSANGKGEKAKASEVIWVIGKGEASWSGDEGDRMTVVASKSKYAPGDTALLVPQTQLPGALALVTLERDGILSYSLTEVATSGQGLKVKVTPELAPNVFASVTLVRGRTGDGDRNRPRFKMGLVDLKVESTVQRLQVTVETERPSYQPGEKVTASVRVTSATGQPVQAELALAVADEGVLQIVGFKTPDPMAAFYAPFGLAVESSTTWNRILRKHAPSNDDGEEGGDGGGDEAGRIRSRFMATAFWAPALLTGEDGRAEVTFKAPDNLTAFRVMAVGADRGARFGSGDKRFTVAKPLQAIPALPRFLAPGDHAQAAVAIHNNTDEKLDVAVTAKIKGVLVRGGSMRKARVPAHGYRRVTFDVVAEHDGEASFVFKAETQNLKDAVLVRIPVRRASIPETLMVGEGSTQAVATHELPGRGEVLPGQGGLELTLDRTGMGRLAEGLSYLVGYPYGCLEQTTSKVVPMIALAELAKSAHLPGLDGGQARKFIEIGIAKILRHQHEDGGFGLWIGANPEPHYTATGLWGLWVAKAAGFQVDEAALERGARYLRDSISKAGISHGTEFLGVRGTQAFAEYVLATLGHADAGMLARLHEDRGTLPIYGRAFLLRALLAAGRADLAKSLADELSSTVPASGLIHEVAGELSWYWSSDVRTTALVEWALSAATPGDPRLSRLADALLRARVDGRWGNTQENVFGLLALSELAKARASAGKVTVTVRLGDEIVARNTVSAESVEHVFVPLAKLGTRPLRITAEGGEIFYNARIRVERAMSGEKFDHGIVVERAYLNPDNQQPIDNIKLGEQVLVRITVSSPIARAHIAVVDRLPAGFEPVLKRFSNGDEARPRSMHPWTARWNTLWQNEELRDDRMQIFADTLGKGTSTHDYLVRAASTGTFVAPPASAEAMYDPAVQGRAPARTVEIVK
jgi:uncharacterized protein YfaS (alpha-2-macroglobulin family)